MKTLFVASQDPKSREWVPVARLDGGDNGYALSYTRGALKSPGFVGFGRMSALDRVYYSETLFPFFANRLLSRSRPEYRQFIDWIGLDDAFQDDPMSVLSAAGGIRATDNFEVIALPEVRDGWLRMRFFPKGLRYLPEHAASVINSFSVDQSLYLMHDMQNKNDRNAIVIRSEKPIAMVGYVPRYYCAGLLHLLGRNSSVATLVRRLNSGAPLDMRYLCEVNAQVPKGFDLLEHEANFQGLGDTSDSDRMLAKSAIAALPSRAEAISRVLPLAHASGRTPV